MGRFDTTSNAQLMLGGFRQGTDLSQNQLQGLLQTASFINNVQHGRQLIDQRQQELALREQAQALVRQQYATELQDKFDQKNADKTIAGWLDSWDGASPPPPELNDYALRASKDLRGAVFDAKGTVQKRQRVQSQLQSARKGGTIQSQQKLREEAESLGIDLEPGDFPPTQAAQREEQAKQEMTFVVRDAVEAGLLDPKRGERFVVDAKSDKDVAYVHNLLKQQAEMAKAQQEAVQQQQMQATIGALVQRKRAGQPLTPEEEGLLVTTPSVNQYEMQQPDPAGGNRAAMESARKQLEVAKQNLSAAADYANTTIADDGEQRLAAAQKYYDAAFAAYQRAASGAQPAQGQPTAQKGSTGNMPPELVDKARMLRQQGLTPDQIKASLEADGWRFQ